MFNNMWGVCIPVLVSVYDVWLRSQSVIVLDGTKIDGAFTMSDEHASVWGSCMSVSDIGATNGHQANENF